VIENARGGKLRDKLSRDHFAEVMRKEIVTHLAIVVIRPPTLPRIGPLEMVSYAQSEDNDNMCSAERLRG
jgi:hypothetical protein